jgi:hypothetical protein
MLASSRPAFCKKGSCRDGAHPAKVIGVGSRDALHKSCFDSPLTRILMALAPLLKTDEIASAYPKIQPGP